MKLLIKTILLLISFPVIGSLSGNTADERSLSFYHTHTGDSLQVVYYRQGKYDDEALAQLRIFLADWRNQEQHVMDPHLMDILWQLQMATTAVSVK